MPAILKPNTVLATAVGRLQWAASHLVFSVLGSALALVAAGRARLRHRRLVDDLARVVVELAGRANDVTVLELLDDGLDGWSFLMRTPQRVTWIAGVASARRSRSSASDPAICVSAQTAPPQPAGALPPNIAEALETATPQES